MYALAIGSFAERTASATSSTMRSFNARSLRFKPIPGKTARRVDTTAANAEPIPTRHLIFEGEFRTALSGDRHLLGRHRAAEGHAYAASFWPRNSLALPTSASHFFSCSGFRKFTTRWRI